MENFFNDDQNENILESADDQTARDIIANINALIDQWKTENGIDDLRDITQLQFTGLLLYIQMQYIRPTKCLYKGYPCDDHNRYITSMYNDYVVFRICEYYIYLCMINNKVCKPIEFSSLTGIELDTMARWANMENQRPYAYGTIKTLRSHYENALENGAQNGRNAVGFIATLNHRFSWSSDSKPALTVSITRDQNQIMSTFDQTLIQENGRN